MKKTSIVFTGDIGFDRHMDGKWEDEQLFSQEILDFFHLFVIMEKASQYR